MKKSPTTLVRLYESFRGKLTLETFISVGEPSHLLIWEGTIYESRMCTYSADTGAIFNYVKVGSQEHLNNIALPEVRCV